MPSRTVPVPCKMPRAVPHDDREKRNVISKSLDKIIIINLFHDLYKKRAVCKPQKGLTKLAFRMKSQFSGQYPKLHYFYSQQLD